MPDMPRSETMMRAAARSRARRPSSEPADVAARAALARGIPRRASVSWWLGIVLAAGFAALVTPAITAERWPLRFHASTPTEPGTVSAKQPAPFTVRAPMFAGHDNFLIGGGVVVARGETASADEATIADAIATKLPRGPVVYVAFFTLILVLATLFTHHMRRSTKGRLLRVQLVSLAGLAVLAVAVKLALLATALSALVVPVAALALVPTMVLDRTVGLATGVLAALVVSLLAPFDVGLAILLLVQAAAAGLVVSERPKQRWLAALGAGLVTTLCTSTTYLLLTYLTTGHAPGLGDPLHSAWVAAAVGPALAALLAVPLIPLYQLLVGEITQGKLFALEDLGHPLLRQIADRSPGTWQHSLMMANMAEIAANAIGANGRLVRVGAYFHDLGKSLSPKYFIENLEPTETSPHDQLPPEVSCDAIFAHVTDGILSARKAGLHERVIDFMHMHHGDGVLEYFWAKCREQGNPHGLTIEDFRYPGHPPQSRETAILAICDAVEAASRTLKQPDAAAIDALVQRIVYGKLHLGQLDESGLSMSDLRRISDSLNETLRHANHARIEYPWQKAGQDASASASAMPYASTSLRLDSLDRKPGRDPAARPMPPPVDSDDAFAATADLTPAAHGERARQEASYGQDPPWGESPDPEDSPWANPASEQRIPIAPPSPAQAFDHEPPPAAQAPGTAATAARNTAALLPPARPGRPSTAPPPLAGRRGAADPVRTAGPPAPVDLDNAITNPPPLRRGPSGHPPVPSDPVQLAAELASTVGSAPAARLGTPRPPDDAATRGVPSAAPDAAVASPVALGAPVATPRPAGATDSAITQPSLPSAVAPAPVAVTSTPPSDSAVAGSPPASPRDRASPRKPASQPPRTTGLASDDQRPMETLRGHAGEPVTIRRGPRAPDVLAPPRAAAAPAPELEAFDAGVTDPSLPILAVGDERRVDLPLTLAPPATSQGERKTGWASGLAARIDAALDSDEWTHETPIVPPTQAELRALLGQPDPTRQQPIDEIALLQRRAAELNDGDPPRRSPHPTTEVDPDDIEAAIEIAPPVRRPTHANASGVARPKRSE